MRQINLDEYLQTSEARTDCNFLGAAARLPLTHWKAHAVGEWTEVYLHAADIENKLGCLRVFYRQVDTCFVVSDLGEGLLAYQIRTGNMNPPVEEIVQVIRNAGAGQWGHLVAALRLISSIELPYAICKVMLASYRVSRL